MSDTPSVSVIIPTHNRADMLVRAVESAQRQTFSDLECIVVDDASCDSTPEVMVSLMKGDSRIRYARHEETRYSAGARNTGMRLARGKYVAFLDDDDEWLPTKLERQVALIGGLPHEYIVVYCWADYINAAGRVVRRHRPSLRGDAFAATLVHNAIGCTCSLMLRRDAALRVGDWNETLRMEEDDEYIIRLCRAGKVDFVPEVLVRVSVEHGKPHVSDTPEEGQLLKARMAVQARYALFFDERWKYRRQAAVLESLIGCISWRMGERSRGARHFARAMRLNCMSAMSWRLLAGTLARTALGSQAFQALKAIKKSRGPEKRGTAACLF